MIYLCSFTAFRMDRQDIRSIIIPQEFSFYSNIDKERLKKYKYPVRLKAGLIIFVFRGTCEMSINIEDYKITEESIIAVFPDSIMQISNYSDEFDASFLILMPGYLNNIHLMRSFTPHLSTVMNYPVLNIESKNDRNLIFDYCKLFQRIYERELSNPVSDVTKSLLLALIYELLEVWKAKKIKETEGVNAKLIRKETIYHQFFQLLLKHYKEERSISFYADKLCISAKYLSAVVKSVRTKTVSDMINDAVILDAKAQLKNSDLTISQISVTLNFANPAFFAKYFKKHTGMTPKEYRVS